MPEAALLLVIIVPVWMVVPLYLPPQGSHHHLPVAAKKRL
jgi:hypothetical protein